MISGDEQEPSSPTSPRAKWFKPKDQEIALSRLNRFSRVSPSPINLACLKRTLMNPILYALVWIYVGLLIAPSGNTCECLDSPCSLLPAGHDLFRFVAR